MSGPDELSSAIFACVTTDGAIPRCLALLAERFECPSAAIVFQDRANSLADMTVGYGLLDEAAQRRYRDHFRHHDPAPAAMAAIEVGRATTTGRLFDDSDPSFSYFLEHFYYPLGLRETLGGPVVRHGSRFGLVAVQRGPDRDVFDARDIEAFERLMPAIRHALELRSAFFELERRVGELQVAVDPLPTGVLVLAPDRRIREANLASRAIIDRRDGLFVDRSGRVSAFDETAARRLGELVSGHAEEEVLAVPRSGGREPYVIRSLQHDGPSDGTSSVSLRIHDPDRTFADAEPILAAAFRMSPLAARLTAALLRGSSLAAFSGRERIPLDTVKYHLKAAFAATGTNRQSDLIRRALSLVRDLGR